MNEHARFASDSAFVAAGGSERCGAVVVTFNRSALLRNCLEALGRQTRPLDGIVVVDNASSDDTATIVREFAATSPMHISYRRLAENVGGAGGFSYGTRLAVSMGFDQIWMMDDDGVPADEALQHLLAVQGLSIRNALVVDIDDRSKLAFPLERAPKAVTVDDAKRIGPSVDGCVNPFNGTLVGAAVFRGIGYPYHGFFIWGDEVEFVNRAVAAGHRIATVTGALHYHPSNRKKPYRMFGRFTVNTTDDKRLPIYMRNYSYNLHRRFGLKLWGSFVAKQLAYEVLVSKSPKRVASAMGAALAGVSTFPGQVRTGANGPYDPTVDVAEDFHAAHRSLIG